MSYMIIEYLEGGGTICTVHGINSKTCKRSKKCVVRSGTVGLPVKEIANKTAIA